MNPWRWVDPRIKLVRLAALQAYLLSRGWRLRTYPNASLLRFEKVPRENEPPLIQMVPASGQAADYLQRVAECITVLSELEDRPPVAVLEDILATPSGNLHSLRSET